MVIFLSFSVTSTFAGGLGRWLLSCCAPVKAVSVNPNIKIPAEKYLDRIVFPFMKLNLNYLKMPGKPTTDWKFSVIENCGTSEFPVTNLPDYAITKFPRTSFRIGPEQGSHDCRHYGLPC